MAKKIPVKATTKAINTMSVEELNKRLKELEKEAREFTNEMDNQDEYFRRIDYINDNVISVLDALRVMQRDIRELRGNLKVKIIKNPPTENVSDELDAVDKIISTFLPSRENQEVLQSISKRLSTFINKGYNRYDKASHKHLNGLYDEMKAIRAALAKSGAGKKKVLKKGKAPGGSMRRASRPTAK